VTTPAELMVMDGPLSGGVAGKVEELQWVSAFTSLLLFVLLLG